MSSQKPKESCVLNLKERKVIGEGKIVNIKIDQKGNKDSRVKYQKES